MHSRLQDRRRVRVGIVGVGNCASSFVQGLTYYRSAKSNEPVPGLMNADSLTLYAGAVIPGPMMDWHSAFLTYCLRLLIRAGAGVALFTAVQSAIYFFAGTTVAFSARP